LRLDQKSATLIVKNVLMADFACEKRGFDEEGVFVYQAREIEGARRFPLPEKFLAVVTMGTGVVISCSPGRLRWAKSNLSRLSSIELFSAPAIARMENYVARDNQFMAGPDLKYICTRDNFQPFTLVEEIEVSLVEGKEVQTLYENNQFPNALGHSHNPQRPRVVAALAEHKDVVTGVAAASADCDSMWQVGVDVLPNYRNCGIGKALVSKLTEALFMVGKLPYCSTAISNIASRRTVSSLGYRPTWVEVYSREKSLP